MKGESLCDVLRHKHINTYLLGKKVIRRKVERVVFAVTNWSGEAVPSLAREYAPVCYVTLGLD